MDRRADKVDQGEAGSDESPKFFGEAGTITSITPLFHPSAEAAIVIFDYPTYKRSLLVKNYLISLFVGSIEVVDELEIVKECLVVGTHGFEIRLKFDHARNFLDLAPSDIMATP